MDCKKRQYKTKEEAIFVIKQIQIQNALKPGKRNSKEQSYYFCDQHQAWHITSQFNKKNSVKGIDDLKKIVKKEIDNDNWEKELGKNKRKRF